MPHLFTNDVLGLALSLLLGVPVVTMSGYFIGATLDLFSFNSQSVNIKWSLSVLFGVALTPVLLYIPGRLISTSASWLTLSVMILLGTSMLYRQNAWPRWTVIPRSAKIAVTIWVFIAAASLLDVAEGSKLYPSSAIIDMSYRSQVVASLGQSHSLPPASFFFFPGHEVAFHYHYFLFLLAAAFMKIGDGFITARMALAALIVWVGFGVLALISTYVELFTSVENKRRATSIGWFLVLVGGLDLIPFGTEIAGRIVTHQADIVLLPDVEWWNRFAVISSWYDSLIWQAHHVAGLIACLMGVLLLWHSRNLETRQQLLSAIGAAVAFASATGTSILVTIVFGAFLLIVAIELLLNDPKKSWPLLASGMLALLLLLPFLHELHGGSAQNLNASFRLAVRPFLPATLLLNVWGIQSPILWNLAFLVFLPVNYFLELGAFFIAGLFWLAERRSDRSGIVRRHLMLGLLLVSLLMSSFVYWGSERSNDFGYRAVLPAQFILLLWTIEIVEQFWPALCDSMTRRHRLFHRVLAVAVMIGLLSNVANFLLMRSRVAVAELASSPAEVWPPSAHPAQLMYELRSAYIWIRDHSSPSSIVQQNPEPYLWIEKKQYSERMAAIQGLEQDSRSEGSKAEFEKTLKLARTLFSAGMETRSMRVTCESLKVRFVLVQDSDPIWQDPNSYVWQLQPSFQASRVRVFDSGMTDTRSAPSVP
jgi:hypothetical protein